MSSFSSGDAKDDEWKYKIYFDPEADKTSGSDYWIGDDDLRGEMTRLVEGHEHIIQVSAYKCPLSNYQLTQLLFNHQFVVYETKEWWWSVEKNSEGITIQRSKSLAAVKDRYRQSDRPEPVELLEQDSGRRNMNELIQYLWQKNELNKEYSLLGDNCKHFAKRIFDEIASKKFL